jgi:hypothetical protein
MISKRAASSRLDLEPHRAVLLLSLAEVHRKRFTASFCLLGILALLGLRLGLAPADGLFPPSEFAAAHLTNTREQVELVVLIGRQRSAKCLKQAPVLVRQDTPFALCFGPGRGRLLLWRGYEGAVGGRIAALSAELLPTLDDGGL